MRTPYITAGYTLSNKGHPTTFRPPLQRGHKPGPFRPYQFRVGQPIAHRTLHHRGHLLFGVQWPGIVHRARHRSCYWSGIYGRTERRLRGHSVAHYVGDRVDAVGIVNHSGQRWKLGAGRCAGRESGNANCSQTQSVRLAITAYSRRNSLSCGSKRNPCDGRFLARSKRNPFSRSKTRLRII